MKRSSGVIAFYWVEKSPCRSKKRAGGYDTKKCLMSADIVVIGALAILGFATSYQVFHAEGAVAFVGHVVDDQQLHGALAAIWDWLAGID